MGEITNNQHLTENSEIQQAPLIVPESKGLRVVYGLATIALPIISFLISFESTFVEPEWQDGKLTSYLQLMTGGPASYYFYPLMIYSMICMGLLLANPEKEANFFVRFGIYTGMIFSLQYSIIVLAPEDGIPVLFSSMAWIFSFTSVYLGIIFLRLIFEHLPPHLNFLIYALGIGILVIILYDSVNLILLGLLLPAGPLICLFISLQISIRLVKHHEIPIYLNLWQRMAVVVWVGSYLVAWRFSILKALELYSQLPTEPPPDCYIATAATKGHPTIVRSHPVNLSNGAVMQVNAQLQVLKAAEITLKTISPKIHHSCRMVYDRYGKVLARRLTTPTRGTLAYLGLKPFEWAARLTLRLLLPGIKEISNNLYTNEW